MESVGHLAHVAWLKNLSYIGMFFVTAEYFGFSTESTAIFVALMTIDVFTGVTRAAIVEGGSSVRSAVWTRGVLAKLLLMTALFSMAIASKGVGIDGAPFANGAINVLILSELYSILGNIHSIRTRKPKAEFDSVAWLLAHVRSLLEKTIK